MTPIALPLPRHAGRTRAALGRLFAAAARLLARPRFESLDDAALRDLGLGRSDLASFGSRSFDATPRTSLFETLHRGM